MFRAFVGDGFLAGFAYRRAEQLPRNRRELEAARRRLERAAKQRSPSYRLRSSRITRVAGARAIELVGDQKVSNGRLRTRSLHVYKGAAEYVFELGVPAEEFERLDSAIFPVLRDTLKVSGKVRRRALMPELPEVETIRRQLAPHMEGRVLERSRCWTRAGASPRTPARWRTPCAAGASRRCAGAGSTSWSSSRTRSTW